MREDQNLNQNPKQGEGKNGMTRSDLIGFAFDLGFSIIIPLVIFAFGGRWLDVKFDSSPLFLIIGLLVSLVFTGIAVYRKTKNFLQ